MGALVIINFGIYRAQRLGVHSFDEINVFFLFFRPQFTQCIMTASSVGEHININLIIIIIIIVVVVIVFIINSSLSSISSCTIMTTQLSIIIVYTVVL